MAAFGIVGNAVILGGQMRDIRDELKGEIKDVWGEIKDVRGELKDVRGELKDVRDELKGGYTRVQKMVMDCSGKS
ncbi:MAG: hypothetical protein Q9196_003472 [Gyalolechia fulgens]